MNPEPATYLIHIEGLVQGVGFRPFIYRLAMKHGVRGTVENSNDGVWIHAYTDNGDIESFLKAIEEEAPPASRIWRIGGKKTREKVYNGFHIVESHDRSTAITQVSPDIAVCEDCLADMKEQPNRLDYPFVNCTNCGPRFSIIKDLPYDRDKTTMHVFTMCPSCRREYEDVNDRRFHAQPVACANCGPHYTLWKGGKKTEDLGIILKSVSKILLQGGLVAVKGLGGYFLACDATCEGALRRLREAKLREGKPFAVMFRDLNAVREFVEIDAEEEKELISWKRPIVLLRENRKQQLAPGVSVGFPTVGAMLPYMPFHYLLFETLPLPALVLTSGNLSDEPILTDDKEALQKLGPVTDAVLSYNREIYNRVDDSVMFVVNHIPRMIRRSRGFVPAPVPLAYSVEGILATGAELVNCFCMGKDHQAIMSQHIGDLKNYETWKFYSETIDRFKRLFRVEPVLVACDLHPDYLSTQYAMETKLPVVQVQHHHAHIAAVMAEHALEGEVLGVSFDGTGLGDDGNIWGGEFMVCDYSAYKRITHLSYVPMPGGDKAALQPWRMALAYLFLLYGVKIKDMKLRVVEKAKKENKLLPVMQMISQKINTPLTSSMGRLFDAVAALTGICMESGFHAEAPMRLEAAASEGEKGKYPWTYGETIDVLPMMRAIVKDVTKGIAPGIISAKFHHTIADIIVKITLKMRKETGIDRVILSGGTFQNRILLEESEKLLQDQGFCVYHPVEFPVNDGGIALGQLAVAAAGRERVKAEVRNEK